MSENAYSKTVNIISIELNLISIDSYVEVAMMGEITKERSCTSLNTPLANKMEKTNRRVQMMLIMSLKNLSIREGLAPCNSMMGFMPYKRCLAEREANSSMSSILFIVP